MKSWVWWLLHLQAQPDVIAEILARAETSADVADEAPILSVIVISAILEVSYDANSIGWTQQRWHINFVVELTQ